MARNEVPKEDLLRDAIAFVDRVEFTSRDAAPLFVGFRENGRVSFYFGEEPVYQFDADRALRRAHDQGMIKAEGGRLVKLVRNRVEGEVQLLRTVMTSDEQEEFLGHARLRLEAAARDIHAGSLVAARTVTANDEDLSHRVCEWIAALDDRIKVADGL